MWIMIKAIYILFTDCLVFVLNYIFVPTILITQNFPWFFVFGFTHHHHQQTSPTPITTPNNKHLHMANKSSSEPPQLYFNSNCIFFANKTRILAHSISLSIFFSNRQPPPLSLFGVLYLSFFSLWKPTTSTYTLPLTHPPNQSLSKTN